MVVALVVVVASHDDAFGFDADTARLGQFQHKGHFGHHGNGLDGVTKDTVATDVIHVIEDTRIRLVLDALEARPAPGIAPAFLLVFLHGWSLVFLARHVAGYSMVPQETVDCNEKPREKAREMTLGMTLERLARSVLELIPHGDGEGINAGIAGA